MKITIEGASEEFEQRLLTFFADPENRDGLTVSADTEWTVDRAAHYLRSLTAGARQFAEIVVEHDGYAGADVLRAALGKLQGPTVALTGGLKRGVREGRWPAGTRAPITVVYDPENPSWQKAIAYEMAAEDVPVFRAALAHVDATRQAARAAGLHPGGPGKTTLSPAPDSVFEKTGFTPIDLDGGPLPATDDTDHTDEEERP
jgi:hypothetical protein